MKAVDKTRMIRLYRGQEAAIVSQFNGKIRVLDGQGKELFFSELTNALKHLMNEGYFIEYLFSTTMKAPEENRL